MIPWIRRHSLAALLLAVCAELLLAGWWRWPWTMAPIQTPFDYGTGHVAVVSENWRRLGARRQHFLPVMSTDPRLPEWPYRTEFSQEYFSVPPLAFILHYGATRLIPAVEPVLLGKLLAQTLICASTLAAAVFLYRVFGAWPTFVGLSFLISGVPCILWFANGYFAVNAALAVQLVLVSWGAAVAAASLNDRDGSRSWSTTASFGLGAAFAFAGGFADYLPTIANAMAVGGFLALAAIRWKDSPRGRRVLLAASAGVATGALVAGVSTIVLYSRQMGFARYRQAITQRVADRTGHAEVAEHFDVIRRQMLTAWPSEMLVVLAIMLAMVLAWCVISLAKERRRPASHPALVTLLALALSIGPSFVFHYRAVNYVSIHWWFAGTWVIGWAITVCAFVWLAGRLAGSVRTAPSVAVARGYAVFCVLTLAALVAANVRFVNAQPVEDPRLDAVRLYRSLGGELPPDGVPLVVTDLPTYTPELFEDFPFATAYLRRPILIREQDGRIRLPAVDEGAVQRIRLGGEDAGERLLLRGGSVYIAYDPDARTCYAASMPLSTELKSLPVRVCRTSAAELVRRPDAVLGPLSPAYPCQGPPLPPADFHVVSNHDGVVSLEWSAPRGRKTSYILEAGSAPGKADITVRNLGWATRFTTPANPATYYARIRRKNACGTGDASNELVVVVE